MPLASAARSSRVAAVPLSPTTASSAPSFDTAAVPLPGREAEFDAVLGFVNARLLGEHERTLFLCGACGCGKTSTVLRAMRSFHTKPLPCDRQVLGDGVNATGICKGTFAPVNATEASTSGKRARSTAARPPRGLAKVARKEATAADGASPSAASSANKSTASTAPATGAAADGLSSDGTPDSATLRDSRGSIDASVPGKLPRRLFSDAADNVVLYRERYPMLYAAVLGNLESSNSSNSSSSSSSNGSKCGRAAPMAARRATAAKVNSVQGHYVNSADLNPQQLADALRDSLCLAYPRPSAPVAAFMAEVRDLPEKCKRQRGWEGNTTTGYSGGGRRAASSIAGMPLQVLVLDEVEYLRPAARAVLATLASSHFQRTWRLALICISNQRDLVHIPQMSLEELAFSAYNAEALREIGRAVAEEEIAKRFGGTESASGLIASARSDELTTVATATAVTISPSLYEYVARKALLEYAGDVRQVAAMCRRVVYTAWEEWRAKREALAAQESETSAVAASGGRRVRNGAAAGAVNTSPRARRPTVTAAAGVSRDGIGNLDTLASKLEAAVDSYSAPTSGRPSTSSTTSSLSTTAAATPAAASPSSAVAGQTVDRNRCDVSLASSMRVIKGSAVQDHLRQHMETMPEQTLYLLSCLIVLSLRKERDNRGAAMAIGGRPHHGHGSATSSSSLSASLSSLTASTVANSTAITQRDTHGLYMRLMARHHFPPMNGSGVATAVSYLADLGIITRPQQRGNEEVFSLSGTWSIEAMETALIERGERLRRELEACGLDGSQNRFSNVLRELKILTGLTF